MSEPDPVPEQPDAPRPSSRGRWLVLARVVFLAAAVGFGWLWLRDDWDDVVAAMRSVSVGAAAWSLLAVLAGLLLTGFVWGRCLRRFGHDVPTGVAMSVFFVGQLGKYIPGSVWSLGAQAQMATRHGVPARTTVAAGLVFLGWNVVTAAFVTSAGFLVGSIGAIPWWVSLIVLIASVACMTPRVVNAAGSWAAGGRRLALTGGDCTVIVGLLLVTWYLYGVALHAVSPDHNPYAYGSATAAVVFTAAYAVGVIVIVAPAGLGAREAVLTLLLTPFLGVAGAAAAALLTRVVHTVADFFMAGAAWLLGRGSTRPAPPG